MHFLGLFHVNEALKETDMVKARLHREGERARERARERPVSQEINRINLRNDLDRADMNIEINK